MQGTHTRWRFPYPPRARTVVYASTAFLKAHLFLEAVGELHAALAHALQLRGEA